MKNFFKKNWFGIAMTAGMGMITWLTYLGGKMDGSIEAYSDIADCLQETLEKATQESIE